MVTPINKSTMAKAFVTIAILLLLGLVVGITAADITETGVKVVGVTTEGTSDTGVPYILDVLDVFHAGKTEHKSMEWSFPQAENGKGWHNFSISVCGYTQDYMLTEGSFQADDNSVRFKKDWASLSPTFVRSSVDYSRYLNDENTYVVKNPTGACDTFEFTTFAGTAAPAKTPFYLGYKENKGDPYYQSAGLLWVSILEPQTITPMPTTTALTSESTTVITTVTKTQTAIPIVTATTTQTTTQQSTITTARTPRPTATVNYSATIESLQKQVDEQNSKIDEQGDWIHQILVFLGLA